MKTWVVTKTADGTVNLFVLPLDFDLLGLVPQQVNIAQLVENGQPSDVIASLTGELA